MKPASKSTKYKISYVYLCWKTMTTELTFKAPPLPTSGRRVWKLEAPVAHSNFHQSRGIHNHTHK